MPPAHAGRASLEALFEEVAAGVAATQDSVSGLWCQVVDKCDESDSWYESSGIGMFICALSKGVELGLLDNAYRAVAEEGRQGITAQMSSADSVGPVINGAAKAMSIRQDYTAYVSIEQLSYSAHGLCAVLLAAAAMEYR